MVPLHETPAQKDSLLWFQAPSQNIIPLIPYSGTGSPGNAGDISPGRQPSTDVLCFFSPSSRADHPLTTPVLHCLGGRQDLPGQVRSMPQVFREAHLCLTLAAGELHMPAKYLLPELKDTGTEFVVLLYGVEMEEPKYVLLILSFFECKWFQPPDIS